MANKTRLERSKSALNKKMTKKLKNKWVKALESGDYKQCGMKLQSKDGENCCLGVLCRVMRIKHKSLIDNGELDDVGLDKVMPKDVQEKLIRMNDVERKSFQDIADFLKKTKEI
jgi:hypothetical protein